MRSEPELQCLDVVGKIMSFDAARLLPLPRVYKLRLVSIAAAERAICLAGSAQLTAASLKLGWRSFEALRQVQVCDFPSEVQC